MQTITGEQKQIPGLNLFGEVIDLDPHVHTQSTTEQVAVTRPVGMIARQYFQTPLAQAEHTAVPHMKQVQRTGFENRPGKGRDQRVMTGTGLLAVVIKPGIERTEHPPCSGLHIPGVGCAVVIVEKVGNGRTAGLLGVVTAADTVGHAKADALVAHRARGRLPQGKRILVLGFNAGTGETTERNGQVCAHVPRCL